MGAIEDRVTITTAEIRNYIQISTTDDDTLLEALRDAALRAADEYLNNPFEELIPQVVFSGVEVDDSIAVDGITFTAKATTDEDERQFAVGTTDSDTADNFCALVNSTTLGGSYGTVGVENVIATNTNGTVKFTRRYPRVTDITVTSSDETKLLVRYVLTQETIPPPIKMWCLLYIKRHYENRDGRLSESVEGLGNIVWRGAYQGVSMIGEDYSLIAPYRLIPGVSYA